MGYLYLPLNTAAPDYYGGHRPGDNLFAETLLCLDAETGKRVWHYQFVHHGLWDYDLPAAPNLMDITVGGKPVKAVAQITKQGFVFTFDRVTGRPIWPIEERPVPDRMCRGRSLTHAAVSDAARAVRIPGCYARTTSSTSRRRSGRWRSRRVKNFKLGPLFTPPSLYQKGVVEGTLARPSTGGGANWSGAAVDPERGILYVQSRNQMAILRLTPPQPEQKSTLQMMEMRGAACRPPRCRRGCRSSNRPIHE